MRLFLSTRSRFSSVKECIVLWGHYHPAKRCSHLQHSPSVHRLSWLIDRPLSSREVHTSQSFDLQELWEWEHNLISIEPQNQTRPTDNLRNSPPRPDRRRSSTDQVSQLWSHTHAKIKCGLITKGYKKRRVKHIKSSFYSGYLHDIAKPDAGNGCIAGL